MAGSSADIGIRIFLDDAANKGLSLLSGNLRTIGLDALQASRAFGSMSGVLNTSVFLGFAASFVAFGLAIKSAIQDATQFQTILIQMGRAGNLTQAQMTGLGQVLMDVGGHSIFSIEQLGQAFVTLLQRGISAKDIMAGVGQSAVTLAEATGMQAVPAAQLLASTMVSFNIPASQAAHTVDLLQFAIEHGIGPSDTLASSIARLGAIASVMHISLADTIPALDVLTRASGSYATATTQLYYFLNQVKFGTASYRDEIQKLGISFYDAKGNFIGLDSALTLLYKTLQNKSPQEAAQILGSLFNIRSSQGIAILMQDLKGVYDLSNKLKVSTDNLGVAQLRAAQVEQSAAGLWQSFRTNLQDVLTLMGGPFLAVIQPVLSTLNQLSIQLRQFAAVNPQIVASFLALGLAISGAGVVVGIATSAFGGMIGIVLLTMAATVGLTVAIMKVVPAIQLASTQTTPLGNAIRTVGSAFSVVGTFASNVRDGFNNITASSNPLGTAIIKIDRTMGQTAAQAKALADASNGLVRPHVVMTKAMMDAANAADHVRLQLAAVATVEDRAHSTASAASIATQGLSDSLTRTHGAVLGVVAPAKVMTDSFDRASGIIKSTTVAANPLQGAFNALRQVLTAVGNYVKEQFALAWVTMKPALLDAWKNIQVLGTALKPLLPVLGAIAAVIIGILIGAIHGLIAAIATIAVGLAMVIKGVVSFVTGVVQLIMGFMGVMHGLITGNTAMWQNSFKVMWEGVKNIFGGALTAIEGLVIAFGGGILNFIVGFVHGIVSWFQNLANNLVGHSIIPQMLSAILSAFLGFFSAVLGAIAGWIGNMISRVVSFAAQFINSIRNAWSMAQAIVVGALNVIVSIVINGFNNVVGHVISAGFNIINSIRNAMSNAANAVGGGVSNIISFFANLPGRVLGILGGLAGTLYGAGQRVIQGLINGLWSMWSGVTNAISSIANTIASHLPFSPVKMGPLIGIEDSGYKLMSMVATGIKQGAPLVHAAMNDALGGMMTGVPGISRIGTSYAGAAYGSGGAAITPLVINLDGKVIYDNTMGRMRGDLQMNGFARAFR